MTLREKYPDIFMPNMKVGKIPPGWKANIDTFCAAFAALRATTPSLMQARLEVLEVTSYGTLSIYFNWGPSPPSPFDQDRCYTLLDQTVEVVNSVCSACGQPTAPEGKYATDNKDHQHWVCAPCHALYPGRR